MLGLVVHAANIQDRDGAPLAMASIVQQWPTLHHVFPTPDGTHAVCIWEAESVRDVRAFLESYVGHVSRNLYFPVENRDGVGLPSEVEIPDPALPSGGDTPS